MYVGTCVCRHIHTGEPVGQFLSEGQEVPDPGRDHASVLVQRQGKKNQKNKKTVLQIKGSQAGGVCSYSKGHQPFCSIQAFTLLDEAHPHRGGQSALLHLWIQMLILSKNTVTDTPRIMLDQTPGNPWLIKLTPRINHHKATGSIIGTNSPWGPGIPGHVNLRPSAVLPAHPTPLRVLHVLLQCPGQSPSTPHRGGVLTSGKWVPGTCTRNDMPPWATSLL